MLNSADPRDGTEDMGEVYEVECGGSESSSLAVVPTGDAFRRRSTT